MALLEELRTKSLAARKAAMRKDWALPGTPPYLMMSEAEVAVQAEQQALAPHAAFLAKVIADITEIARADRPSRAPTDMDAVKVLRTTVKELQDAATTAGESAYGVSLAEQIAMLAAYLPEPMDEHHLTMAITDAAAFLDTQPVMKEMGRIMKRLNELHPGRIDGTLVRRLIESGAC